MTPEQRAHAAAEARRVRRERGLARQAEARQRQLQLQQERQAERQARRALRRRDRVLDLPGPLEVTDGGVTSGEEDVDSDAGMPARLRGSTHRWVIEHDVVRRCCWGWW